MRRAVPAALAAEALGGLRGATRRRLAALASLHAAAVTARRGEEFGGHAAQRAVLRRRFGRAAAGQRAHRSDPVEEIDLAAKVRRVAVDRLATAAIIGEGA